MALVHNFQQLHRPRAAVLPCSKQFGPSTIRAPVERTRSPAYPVRSRRHAKLQAVYSSAQQQDGPGAGPPSGSSSSAAGVAEYSEDDLRRLTEAEDQQAESELGDAWRSMFAGDLDGLFDFVER